MTETAAFGPPELGITMAPLGVGAWPWGSRFYWGYGKSFGEDDVRAAAFRASLAAGVTMFDTAELYGRGESERILGRLVQERAAEEESPDWEATSQPPSSPPSFCRPLGASGRRPGPGAPTQPTQAWCSNRGRSLPEFHWPIPPARLRVRQWVGGLIEAHREGLVRAVGVSNFGSDLMLRAHEQLSRAGCAAGVQPAAVQPA